LRRLTFHYSGLSLAVPERVKYRYMLEGFDRGWSDPVSAREAVFTNLAAGHYRFRVVATNSDGEWNGNEASLAVQIEPEFWQTGWFRSTAALGGVGLVLLFYRLRLHQLTRRMNLRFEERLAERTRIAQELHDTLLQGFLSASLQLHVAVEHVPAESPARPRLTRILELMQQVIEEGRNAVRGLRSTAGDAGNLEQALARVPEELGSPGGVDFRIVAEGPPRLLHPMIRDEVYRVGREAVVNAFQHAQASLIEVEIEYSARQLRLLVRDNGAGIDEQVLRSGREGHWGLSGMRERAERIGAKLRVWSRAAAGTEVELSVPGEIAFVRGASRRGFSWRGASGPATGKGPEGKRGA
jgi:signal transduction histidine kinase